MSTKKYILCLVLCLVASIAFISFLAHSGLWFANGVASNLICHMDDPLKFEKMLQRYNKDCPLTTYYGNYKAFVEIVTLGGFGWPKVISKAKVTIFYNRDGSKNRIFYYDILNKRCHLSDIRPTSTDSEKT